ncbi:bifunctional protein-serine/threonine kinase/phosphatase [Pseudomonas sp. dw_358]|uniref:bifunctional protein-serine/threonine kinase/phosphatase n=1 Tax=Pseudomonas sp. dw_358 TaxID=2720083 RepID=UPI0021171209|nr:bifunctional protein-serine/threonine kinase/phosphatase [Pseudomonas sp. dw_358]
MTALQALPPLRLRVGHASATGPRAENQDAIRWVQPQADLIASKGCLLALADGVSHCADGRLAAHSTVQALAEDYYATPQTWAVAQSLERVLAAQNRWLHSAARGQSLLTTLTALVLRGQRMTLAHVGDCRAYRWRAGSLEQLTQDHAWQQPGMEHVLTRALGLEGHVLVDFQDFTVVEGDGYVLVSDGVWATLGERGLRDILQGTEDPAVAARLLVETAHRAGSQDNASALVVWVDQLPASDWRVPGERMPVPRTLRPGSQFEGWQVIEALSASRQSTLYRVRDSQGDDWLLKTLPAQLADDTEAAQALLMEEWFLRRVSGRAFVQVHPTPNRQSLYYVQREYPGRTLAAQLHADGPLPMAHWLECASRLLRALGQLHRRNLLHRDIKPENLHWGRDGELRLLDFGLVHCPGLSTAPTSVAGTPSYLAPELYHGAALTPRQDLFAAGVTLYRLLTGRFPYGEIEPFQTPRHGTPASARAARADVPQWLEDWLLRCLDAEPERRFETAEEALLQLDKGERQDSLGPRPLLQRNPLKVWRMLAVLGLLGNLAWVLRWLWRG